MREAKTSTKPMLYSFLLNIVLWKHYNKCELLISSSRDMSQFLVMCIFDKVYNMMVRSHQASGCNRFGCSPSAMQTSHRITYE